jgi:hypothetical protein
MLSFWYARGRPLHPNIALLSPLPDDDFTTMTLQPYFVKATFEEKASQAPLLIKAFHW